MPSLDTVSAELLTPIRNNAVIRLPGRRFPAIAIQGDSLSVLVELGKSVCQRAGQFGDQILSDEANALRELLETIQQQYEQALSAHGIDLPYRR